jgi:hypothetical protein
MRPSGRLSAGPSRRVRNQQWRWRASAAPWSLAGCSNGSSTDRCAASEGQDVQSPEHVAPAIDVSTDVRPARRRVELRASCANSHLLTNGAARNHSARWTSRGVHGSPATSPGLAAAVVRDEIAFDRHVWIRPGRRHHVGTTHDVSFPRSMARYRDQTCAAVIFRFFSWSARAMAIGRPYGHRDKRGRL